MKENKDESGIDPTQSGENVPDFHCFEKDSCGPFSILYALIQQEGLGSCNHKNNNLLTLSVFKPFKSNGNEICLSCTFKTMTEIYEKETFSLIATKENCIDRSLKTITTPFAYVYQLHGEKLKIYLCDVVRKENTLVVEQDYFFDVKSYPSLFFILMIMRKQTLDFSDWFNFHRLCGFKLPEDPMQFIISYLNRNSGRLIFESPLAKALTAFFSYHPLYFSQLNETMKSKLQCFDFFENHYKKVEKYWEDQIKKCTFNSFVNKNSIKNLPECVRNNGIHLMMEEFIHNEKKEDQHKAYRLLLACRSFVGKENYPRISKKLKDLGFNEDRIFWDEKILEQDIVKKIFNYMEKASAQGFLEGIEEQSLRFLPFRVSQQAGCLDEEERLRFFDCWLRLIKRGDKLLNLEDNVLNIKLAMSILSDLSHWIPENKRAEVGACLFELFYKSYVRVVFEDEDCGVFKSLLLALLEIPLWIPDELKNELVRMLWLCQGDDSIFTNPNEYDGLKFTLLSTFYDYMTTEQQNELFLFSFLVFHSPKEEKPIFFLSLYPKLKQLKITNNKREEEDCMKCIEYK